MTFKALVAAGVCLCSGSRRERGQGRRCRAAAPPQIRWPPPSPAWWPRDRRSMSSGRLQRQRGHLALPERQRDFRETTARPDVKIDKDDTVSTFMLEGTSGSRRHVLRQGRPGCSCTRVPFGTGGVAIIYPPGRQEDTGGQLTMEAVRPPPTISQWTSAAACGSPIRRTHRRCRRAGAVAVAQLYYLPPNAAKPIQILTDVRV